MAADREAANTLRAGATGTGGGSFGHGITGSVGPADTEAQEMNRLQQMLQSSPDLINSGPTTPLADAAKKGWVRAATFLLDHGADVNVRTGPFQKPALEAAVEAGNKAMVELLLARGADVNAKDGLGQTPLFVAAQKNYPAVAQVLLSNRADPKVQDENGETPLLLASGSSPDLVRMLLAAGANPNGKDHNGRSPLATAAAYGRSETVQMLLAAGANPNPGTELQDAPLLGAIRKSRVDSAELLLRAGADPNREGCFNDEGHMTPLGLAVSTDQLPMVKLLLKFKADPNNSPIGKQPLIFGALADTNVLGVLLDAGVNIETRTADEANWTPLGAAARQNNAPAVEMLLQHGANPNVRNSNGATPLHWATYGLADLKIFQLLLDHKADPNVRSSNGATPLDSIKQWMAKTDASPEQKKLAGQVAGLLRRQGALDDLPYWDRIEAKRLADNYSEVVFYRDATDWNQFTLFEALATIYRMTANPGNMGMPAASSSPQAWSFPDLTRVVIRRPARNGKSWKEIVIDVDAISRAGNCGGDVPLEWGDVLEIPEKDHLVSAALEGLPQATRDLLDRCLKRTVTVRIHGETKSVEMAPNMTGSGIPEQFSVRWALESSGLLRASSDTTRVKIIRLNARTGRTSEWVVDCSNPLNFYPASGDPNPKLWLRNGDVIEVPEKP